MKSDGFFVDIRPATRPGPVKAYADLRIKLQTGELVLHGFSIIEKDGEPPWIGFPQKQGNRAGKYFPVVEAEGKVREMIVGAVLEGYEQSKSKQ